MREDKKAKKSSEFFYLSPRVSLYLRILSLSYIRTVRVHDEMGSYRVGFFPFKTLLLNSFSRFDKESFSVSLRPGMQQPIQSLLAVCSCIYTIYVLSRVPLKGDLGLKYGGHPL